MEKSADHNQPVAFASTSIEHAVRSREDQQTFRKTSAGMLWRFLRFPFLMLSLFLIPRQMGDEVYGKFAFFMSIYAVMDIISDVSITPIAGRFIPLMVVGGADRLNAFLRTLLLYGLGSTTLVVAAGWFILGFFPPSMFDPAWWPALCVILFIAKLKGTLFAFLYGCNQIIRFTLKEIISSASSLFFVVTLFPLLGLPGAIWGIAFSEGILLILAVAWTRKNLFGHSDGIRAEYFGLFLRFGLGFYLPMMIFSFLQRSGNIFIEYLTGSPVAVTHFDIANQYLIFLTVFLGLFFTLLLPSLTSLFDRREYDRIRKLNCQIMKLCSTGAVLAVFALVSFGPTMIEILWGHSFAPVFDNALVLCLAIIPLLVIYLSLNIVTLEKRTGVFVVAAGLGLGVVLAGVLTLIPAHGARGAAWSFVAGYSAMAALFVVVFRIYFRGILAAIAKVVAVGLVGIPLYFIKTGPILNALLFSLIAAVYVAMLVGLKIIRWDEIGHLWPRIGKSGTS